MYADMLLGRTVRSCCSWPDIWPAHQTGFGPAGAAFVCACAGLPGAASAAGFNATNAHGGTNCLPSGLQDMCGGVCAKHAILLYRDWYWATCQLARTVKILNYRSS
eukprot:GHRR01030718.1.p2 GENE.GHRR01030718.1~~GHRR01030718.1.p2  ORF type:complete len:106 (+),score=24.82 GHRR01030718.1:519-836(+)